MRRVFIVQDRERALFLCPQFGDVGYTQWLHEAGRFDDEESAVEAANYPPPALRSLCPDQGGQIYAPTKVQAYLLDHS